MDRLRGPRANRGGLLFFPVGLDRRQVLRCPLGIRAQRSDLNGRQFSAQRLSELLQDRVYGVLRSAPELGVQHHQCPKTMPSAANSVKVQPFGVAHIEPPRNLRENALNWWGLRHVKLLQRGGPGLGNPEGTRLQVQRTSDGVSRLGPDPHALSQLERGYGKYTPGCAEVRQQLAGGLRFYEVRHSIMYCDSPPVGHVRDSPACAAVKPSQSPEIASTPHRSPATTLDPGSVELRRCSPPACVAWSCRGSERSKGVAPTATPKPPVPESLWSSMRSASSHPRDSDSPAVHLE